MYSSTTNTPANSCRAMKPEQFDQVIEAIANGRYSWACVLILRFAGYNPIHFIPYRTYSRLLKDNQLSTTTPSPRRYQSPIDIRENTADSRFLSMRSDRVRDLEYMDSIEEITQTRGGSLLMNLTTDLAKNGIKLHCLRFNFSEFN